MSHASPFPHAPVFSACTECTQKYKKTSDVVFNDPAAVVGMDATDDNIPAMVSNHEEVQLDLAQAPATSHCR